LVLMVLMVLGADGTTCSSADDTSVAQTALETFHSDLACVSPDLQFPVMKMAVSCGGEREWNQVVSRFRSSDFSEEQRQCLRALGYSKDEQLLQKTLDLAIAADGGVRAQDIGSVIVSVAQNRRGRQLAWQWLQSNFDTILQRYAGGQNFILAAVIEYCTRFFTDLDKVAEIRAFFAEHPVPTAARTIEQALETITAVSRWKVRDLQAFEQWFATNA
jgi:aminopeptidase N